MALEEPAFTKKIVGKELQSWAAAPRSALTKKNAGGGWLEGCLGAELLMCVMKVRLEVFAWLKRLKCLASLQLLRVPS